jgi:hypothetical protein
MAATVGNAGSRTWDLFRWTYADGTHGHGDEMPDEADAARIRELTFVRNEDRFKIEGIRKHLSHPAHEALLAGGLPCNLSILRVPDCRVRTFPVLPTTIHEIYMNGNNLLGLPDLSSFRNLIVLELADNNIPAIVAPLPPNLARLDVSCNAIRSINRDLIRPELSISTYSNPYDPYTIPVQTAMRLPAVGIAHAIHAVRGEGNQMFAAFGGDEHTAVKPRTIYEDRQNVHTRGVQSSVEKNIRWIMSYDGKLGEPSAFHIVCNRINEAYSAGVPWFKRMFKMPGKKPGEILRRYHDSEYIMHGTTIPRLAEKLWQRIEETLDEERQAELEKRLFEEITDGDGVCSNGFMSRLANVFVGFDDACAMQIAPNDALGARIPATIARVRREHKLAEADELTVAANLAIYRATVADLTELEVDRGDWKAWLDMFSDPVLDNLWEAKTEWHGLPRKDWPESAQLEEAVRGAGLDGYFWEVADLGIRLKRTEEPVSRA